MYELTPTVSPQSILVAAQIESARGQVIRLRLEKLIHGWHGLVSRLKTPLTDVQCDGLFLHSRRKHLDRFKLKVSKINRVFNCKTQLATIVAV